MKLQNVAVSESVVPRTTVVGDPGIQNNSPNAPETIQITLSPTLLSAHTSIYSVKGVGEFERHCKKMDLVTVALLFLFDN